MKNAWARYQLAWVLHFEGCPHWMLALEVSKLVLLLFLSRNPWSSNLESGGFINACCFKEASKWHQAFCQNLALSKAKPVTKMLGTTLSLPGHCFLNSCCQPPIPVYTSPRPMVKWRSKVKAATSSHDPHKNHVVFGFEDHWQGWANMISIE